MVVSKHFPACVAFFLSLQCCSSYAVANSEREYFEIRRMMGRHEYSQAYDSCIQLVRRWSSYLPCYETLAEIGYYGDKKREVTNFLLESIDAGRSPGLASYGLGLLHYWCGDSLGAVAAFEDALAFGERASDIYKHLEYAYEKIHGSDAAIRHFNTVSMRSPRDPGYAYAAALAHWYKLDHHNALLKLNDAIALAPHDPRYREALAAVLLSSGDERHAFPMLKECLRAARERRDLASVQFIQSYLLNSEIEKGNWEAAIARGLVMVEEAKEYALLRWLGWGLKKLSDAEFQLGHYVLSVRHVTESIRVARFSRDDVLIYHGLYRLFQCRHELGQYRDALRVGFERVEMAYQQASSYALPYAISDIALVYDALGMKDLALEYAVDALLRSEAIGHDIPLLIQTRTTMGLVQQGLGNYEASIRQFHSVLSLMSRNNAWNRHRAALLGNIGRSYFLLGKSKIAFDYLYEGLKLSRKSQYIREEGYAFSYIGEYYLSRKQFGKAHAFFTHSYRIAQEIEHRPVMLLASRGLAESCELRGMHREALRWYRLARRNAFLMCWGVSSCETYNPKASDEDWRKEVKILCRLGKFEEAFETTQIAKENSSGYASKIRVLASSLGDYSRLDSLDSALGLFRQRLSKLRDRKTPETADKSALPLLWRIGSLELQRKDFIDSLSGISHEQSFKSETRTISVAGVRRSLDRATALVDFVVGKEFTHVFIIRCDTMLYRSIPVTEDSLAHAVSRVSALFRKQGRDRVITPLLADFNRNASRELFRLLFPSWKCDFLGIKQLLLVPDRCLLKFPFECLCVDTTNARETYQSRDSNLFLSLFETVYEASAQGFFAELKPTEGLMRSLLALASPNIQGKGHLTQETTAMGSFNRWQSRIPELPGTEREVALVHKAFNNESTILIGEFATKRRFLHDARFYRILHIAAHAVLDSTLPMYSRIYVSPEIGEERISYLLACEICIMSLNAELVVLSCCSTAPSAMVLGNDGFVRGFREAGVSRVLASLWGVDDEVSVLFMSHFYSHLSSGYTPSRALQEAKLDLIASGYSDPFYWAPYVLVGSPLALTPATFSERRYSYDLISGIILLVIGLAALLIYLSQKPGAIARFRRYRLANRSLQNNCDGSRLLPAKGRGFASSAEEPKEPDSLW